MRRDASIIGEETDRFRISMLIWYRDVEYIVNGSFWFLTQLDLIESKITNSNIDNGVQFRNKLSLAPEKTSNHN